MLFGLLESWTFLVAAAYSKPGILPCWQSFVLALPIGLYVVGMIRPNLQQILCEDNAGCGLTFSYRK